MKTRAWSVITLGPDRQYGGNLGYADDLRRAYLYDSHVANCRNVTKGDLLLIRGRQRLLGIARVKRITEQLATKNMLRCPICRAVDSKARKTKRPKFRCVNGHEFDQPIQATVDVTAFEAHYEGTYIDVHDGVPISAIKAAAPRPSDQLSIEEIEIGRLEKALLHSYPATRELLASFIQSTALDVGDGNPDTVHPAGDGYAPTMTDTRQCILREIKARRGQRKFRDALLKRYDRRCVITGCELVDVLEAAHIWPYRGQQDNHPQNGLLLRADIHTLFDLNLIAIHPQTLEVHLASSLQRIPEYTALHGRRLLGDKPPSRGPLESRWKEFELGRQLEGQT